MGEGGGRRGSDRMEVGFTITYVIIAYIITTLVGFNPVHGEVYSIQHYEITFVSDLRQLGGFLRFSPPVKLITTIQLKYC